MERTSSRRPVARLALVVVLGAALLALGVLLLRSAPEREPGAEGERGAGGAAAEEARLEGRSGAVEEAPGASDGEASEAVETTGGTGRVVDVASAPVEGASVRVLVKEREVASATAGEDGRFALLLPVGPSFTVEASAEGFVPALVDRRLRRRAPAAFDLGDVVLAPALRIAGRVVTEAGHPAAGAELEIEPEADPVPPSWYRIAERDRALAQQEADAEGRFVFAGIPPGRYRVRLSTERAWYGDQVREHVEAGREDVVFTLPESQRLLDVRVTVRVEGPDGEAVPKAQLRLWGGDASLGTYVDQGRETELAVEGATAPVRLLVWNARDRDDTPLGYAPAVVEDVRTQTETLVVRMAAGFDVAGRVVWDGEPTRWNLQASTYRGQDGLWGTDWQDAADPGLWLQTTSDAEGRFRFRGLPRGTVWIGLGSGTWPAKARDGGVKVDVPASDVRLEMVRTGTIHVVVRAPEGEGLRSAGICVEQWVDGGVREVWSSQTSVGVRSKGPQELAFDAGGLATDGRFRLTVHGSTGGHLCGPLFVEDVRPREEAYVVVVEPGPRVVGRVVGPDGDPLAGVQVHPRLAPGGEFDAFLWKPAGLMAGWATTDEDGAFALDVAAGPAYMLALEDPAWTTLSHPPVVRPGPEPVRVVAEPARAITGRLLDDAGAPADGFRVTGVPAEGVPALWVPTRAAADGFFAAPVGAGSWRVSAWNADDEEDLRYALSDPLEAGSADVRLTLVPGAALAGRLLDGLGRPVGGVYVWVLGPHVNRTAQSDGEGRFLVHGIPPGRYEVFVRMPDGAERKVPAAVTGVGTPTALDLVLER